MSENQNEKQVTLESLQKEIDELKAWKQEVVKFFGDQVEMNQAFSNAINAFGNFTKVVEKQFMKFANQDDTNEEKSNNGHKPTEEDQ